MVCVQADHWLVSKEAVTKKISVRKAICPNVRSKTELQHRVDRWKQCLHDVAEEVTKGSRA